MSENEPRKQSSVKNSSKEPQTVKREMSNTIQVFSDMFKLKVANLKRNFAAEGFEPVIKDIEHCHFYRTFDSSGKKCDFSESIGGHKHPVEVFIGEDGRPAAKCGAAVFNSGKNAVGDNHTHDIEYINSGKVDIRKANLAATNAVTWYNKQMAGK